MLVLDRESCTLPERHRPIAVEPARGVDRNRQRVHVVAQGVAVAEEVTQGHLDRGSLLPIPIEPKNCVPIGPGIHRNPDVLDNTRALDVGQTRRGRRLERDAGPDLPTLAQHGTSVCRVGHRFCTITALASRILSRDRACLSIGEQRQATQAKVQQMQITHVANLPSIANAGAVRAANHARFCDCACIVWDSTTPNITSKARKRPPRKRRLQPVFAVDGMLFRVMITISQQANSS